MKKTSTELKQKAAGFMLAASNALKREMKEKNHHIVTKTTIIKTIVIKTTKPKKK